MKKLLQLLFGLAFVLALGACSKDNDDDEGAPQSSIQFDGKAYPVSTGIVYDYGAANGFYNYDFVVSNIPVDQIENDNPPKGGYVLYLELFSPGSSFKTGTYTFSAWGDGESSEAYFARNANKQIFSDIEFVIDLNGDGAIQDNESLESTGGTVTVSGGGSNYNYTVSYDITLEGGKKVTGSYSANFRYFNEID